MSNLKQHLKAKFPHKFIETPSEPIKEAPQPKKAPQKKKPKKASKRVSPPSPLD